MSPEIPTWWEFTLLFLAAFRIYRLIGQDTILDRPRRWLLRLGNDWEPGMTKAEEMLAIPENYRAKWGTFITCPWCAGFWISVIWWLAWWAEAEWTLFAATPFAISAVVGLTAKNLDAEEE